jgi:hypothetical protein
MEFMMKRSKLLPVTFSAIALAVSAPHIATAKNVSHHIAPMSSTVREVEHVKVGQIDTTKQGVGTYRTVVSGSKDDKTFSTTESFSDGVTVDRTRNVVTIDNANGSVTKDVTTTLNNGKTVTKDETLTATGTAGDYSVSGDVTQSNGKVDELSGSKDATAYGTDTSLTLTNGTGEVKTMNDERLKSGDAVGNLATGTGFKGQTIDDASLRTTGKAQSANDVDTTVDGQGTFTVNSSSTNGTVTRVADRTFQDGATDENSTATTVNANGTTTVNASNSATTETGQRYSSASSETYTPNGNNNESISGTFSQSNGYAGTLSGSDTKTNYGSVTNLSYVDPNGSSKTAQTAQLVVGNAVLNINTATTFAGKANDSVGLITTASNTN